MKEEEEYEKVIDGKLCYIYHGEWKAYNNDTLCQMYFEGYIDINGKRING